MKKILLLVTFVALSLSVLAKPARPGFFRYVQPDGSTVLIQRHGDEWGHWTTDGKGRVVERGADGFYRPVAGMTPTKAAQGAAIRGKAARQKRASSPSRAPLALGTKRFLLVLVEFSDLAFTAENSHEAFDRMINQPGYSANGASGSVRDFYFDNSHGVFEPVFDVFGPVKLEKEMAYYGANNKEGNDERASEALRDALAMLDKEVDFSRYDQDNDGIVDLVYMIYAGKGEADGGDDDSIWPHQWDLRAGGIELTLDGKTVGRYACGSELNGSGVMDGIGTLCHEFGHALGLPDFYDTDYDTNGHARTLLGYSVMDLGSYNDGGRTPPYFNMEERILLGWLEEDAIPVFTKDGEYTLEPLDNNVAYKTLTDTEGEYFVFECRPLTGWDRFIPAPGLIVYHVDKSARQVSILDANGRSSQHTAKDLWVNWSYTNAINENGEHPCFYVEASAAPGDVSFGMEYYSGYGYYFNDGFNKRLPFPGEDKVTELIPVSWNGILSDVKISGIAFASDRVTFQVQGLSSGILDYPVIANPGEGRYQAGSQFNLSLVLPAAYVAEEVKWLFDGTPVNTASVTLSAGTHVVEAQVSLEGGRKDIIALEIEVE